MEEWAFKAFETSVTGAILLFVLWQIFKHMLPKLDGITEAINRNTNITNELAHHTQDTANEMKELRKLIMKLLKGATASAKVERQSPTEGEGSEANTDSAT